MTIAFLILSLIPLESNQYFHLSVSWVANLRISCASNAAANSTSPENQERHPRYSGLYHLRLVGPYYSRLYEAWPHRWPHQVLFRSCTLPSAFCTPSIQSRVPVTSQANLHRGIVLAHHSLSHLPRRCSALQSHKAIREPLCFCSYRQPLDHSMASSLRRCSGVDKCWKRQWMLKIQVWEPGQV